MSRLQVWSSVVALVVTLVVGASVQGAFRVASAGSAPVERCRAAAWFPTHWVGEADAFIDWPTGIRLCEEALALVPEDPLALASYGRALTAGGRPVEGLEVMRRAAATGSPDGQFGMGWLYDDGRAVAPDGREAANWYRKAAAQGFARAAFHLGELYMDGQGVAQDPAEAAGWYLSAAEGGDPRAQAIVTDWLVNPPAAAARERLEERARAGSVTAEKLSIAWSLASIRRGENEEALRRLERLAASDGRAQPWLDGDFRDSLRATVAGPLPVRANKAAARSAARRIAAVLRDDWSVGAEAPGNADLWATLRRIVHDSNQELPPQQGLTVPRRYPTGARLELAVAVSSGSLVKVVAWARKNPKQLAPELSQAIEQALLDRLGGDGGNLGIHECQGPWDAPCIVAADHRLYLEDSPIARPKPPAGARDCAPAPRRLRALLIGVSHYDSGGYGDLKGPANDLRYLKTALQALPVGEKDIRVLQDSEARYATVIRGLDDLVQGADCDDLLWVHFSGNGGSQAGLLLPDWKEEGRPVDAAAADSAPVRPSPSQTLAVAANGGALGARDLAALVIAARAGGADVVLSMSTCFAAGIDLWPWMGHTRPRTLRDQANQLTAVFGLDDWWVAPGRPESSAREDWMAPLLGPTPGAFLTMAPSMDDEVLLDRCAGTSGQAAGALPADQGGDECKQVFGGFSFLLAGTLMAGGWSTPEGLARKLRDTAVPDLLAQTRSGAIRFVSSDREFTIVGGEPAVPAAAGRLGVEVTNPLTRGAAVIRVRENVLKLEGRLTDLPLPDLLIVNGQATALRSTGAFSVEVPMKSEKSVVQLVGAYRDGSLRRTDLAVQYEGKAEDLLASYDYYALLIGNQDYVAADRWPRLATPLRDVEAVRQRLVDRYGFKTNVSYGGKEYPLVLNNAKKDEILRTLAVLKKTLRERDRLLIYYAGHGYAKDQRAYWIPVDGSGDLLDDYTWINSREVANQLKELPAASVLVVADSCFSGGFARFGEPEAADARDRAADERVMQSYLAEAMGRTSRKLLSSGADEPVADGGGAGHSIFARALLTGLDGMGRDAFSGSDLYGAYIKHQVTGASPQAPQYEQIQDSGHQGGDFVFVRRLGKPPGQ